MEDSEKPFATCYHCQGPVMDEFEGLGMNMGEGPKYLCRKCNEEFGVFEFRRKFQIMTEKESKE